MRFKLENLVYVEHETQVPDWRTTVVRRVPVINIHLRLGPEGYMDLVTRREDGERVREYHRWLVNQRGEIIWPE